MKDIECARRDRHGKGYSTLLKEVANQVAGSDLETGYSFVYIWLANQFGHFMIGFAGTILCVWIVSLFAPTALTTGAFWQCLALAALVGALWLAAWFAKEILVDLRGALRNLNLATAQREAVLRGERVTPTIAPPTRITRQDLLAIQEALRTFWRNPVRRIGSGDKDDERAWLLYDVVRDSAIDGWFYTAGVLTAIAMYTAPGIAPGAGWPWLLPIATFIAVLLISLPISRDWLWEKIAFDKAMLPFVGRIALNSRPYEAKQRRTAIDFATGALDGVRQLVIVGPPKSGRTTTAVALGVEALLRSCDNTVVYTTWCKLLDSVAEERHLYQKERQGPPGERSSFPLEHAELLIVDDVGAEAAQSRPLISAEAFAAELQRNSDLRAKLGKKRIIWVVGDDPQRGQQWLDALRASFGPIKIEAVAPGETLSLAERRGGLRRAA